jgi:hypothetical protein
VTGVQAEGDPVRRLQLKIGEVVTLFPLQPSLLGIVHGIVGSWNMEWWRLVFSKGPNRVGVSPYLRTETAPVSEMSVFLSSNSLESGRWTKSENPLILCVIHHRQNPVESTWNGVLCGSDMISFLDHTEC